MTRRKKEMQKTIIGIAIALIGGGLVVYVFQELKGLGKLEQKVDALEKTTTGLSSTIDATRTELSGARQEVSGHNGLRERVAKAETRLDATERGMERLQTDLTAQVNNAATRIEKEITRLSNDLNARLANIERLLAENAKANKERETKALWPDIQRNTKPEDFPDPKAAYDLLLRDPAEFKRKFGHLPAVQAHTKEVDRLIEWQKAIENPMHLPNIPRDDK